MHTVSPSIHNHLVKSCVVNVFSESTAIHGRAERLHNSGCHLFPFPPIALRESLSDWQPLA